MNVETILARECPRYIQKETIFHGEKKKLIVDTHDYLGEPYPIKVFSVDEDITLIVEEMNAEYETQLRRRFDEF